MRGGSMRYNVYSRCGDCGLESWCAVVERGWV